MASTVLGGAALSIAGLKEDIMRKMCLLAAALTVTIASAHPGAHAQFMRQEIHTFQSSEMTEAEFLTGKKGTPVMLAGQLRMPKLVGKQPVVVLLHGAGGIGPSKHIIAAWADVINEAGNRRLYHRQLVWPRVDPNLDGHYSCQRDVAHE